MVKIQSKFNTVYKYILNQTILRNRFVTENKYSSLYWLSVLIGTLSLGVYLSYDIVLKWYNSPVNRFITNEPRHLSENPFPAITICLNDPISSDTMNLASVLDWERQNKTDEELETLNVVYHMCSWKHKIIKLNTIDHDFAYKVIKEFTTKCEDTIKQIRWKDTFIKNPCDIMQPIFLLNNLCFSFNALPYYELYREIPYKLQEILKVGEKWSKLTSSWNMDDGYSNNGSIPWRTNSTGYWNSVEFILAQNDSYYGCSSKQGFTVYFHSPSDVPDYSHSSIKFSKGTHSFIQIETVLSLTDNYIKNWTPKNRGCYYSQEKWLKYNKIYSYKNCYVECQVNYTQNMCGCSPIHRLDSSYPMCGPKLENCVASATVLTERAYHACKCLPSCTDFDYELSYSIIKKNFRYISKSLTFMNNSTNSNNLASIEVTVNLEHTWPFKRNAEETNIGYISQIAGISNLCRGLSLISLLEIIYFMFINPFFQ